jgi:hypothetical protein
MAWRTTVADTDALTLTRTYALTLTRTHALTLTRTHALDHSTTRPLDHGHPVWTASLIWSRLSTCTMHRKAPQLCSSFPHSFMGSSRHYVGTNIIHYQGWDANIQEPEVSGRS